MELRLSRLQLNELELLEAGAYGSEMRYHLPSPGVDHASLRVPEVIEAKAITLLDLEATPAAVLEVDGRLVDGESTWVAGVVRRLRPSAPSPFVDLRPGNAPRAPSGRATLALRWHLPTDIGGTIIVVDEGDPHALSQAVSRASRTGDDVRVLPAPAAEHVPSAQRSELLAHLARVFFAQDVATIDGSTSARGHGLVMLFTGLSGSGKSTIARELTRRLRTEGTQRVTLLDGDEVRSMLSSGLGFSREDRELNVRRIAWVASQVSAHDGIAICAPIAPYESMRREARDMAELVGRFVLVHIATPLEVCEERDRKGLYSRARAGEIKQFTGISDPYEAPTDADVVIDTSTIDVATAVGRILSVVWPASGDAYAI